MGMFNQEGLAQSGFSPLVVSHPPLNRHRDDDGTDDHHNGFQLIFPRPTMTVFGREESPAEIFPSSPPRREYSPTKEQVRDLY